MHLLVQEEHHQHKLQIMPTAGTSEVYEVLTPQPRSRLGRPLHILSNPEVLLMTKLKRRLGSYRLETGGLTVRCKIFVASGKRI